MGGSLITPEPGTVVPGTKVVIFVDSANQPTGIWEGEITNFYARYIGSVQGQCSWECKAVITDSRASEKWLNKSPYFVYDVMFPNEALSRLFARIDESKQEINGLKKRLETERNVLYGAMKAMVSSDAMDKFFEALGLKEGGKKI
jgi:hypothetical protein